MEDLIPGLPNDVGMLCLGRTSYQSHAAMQGVCKKWKELTNNPSYFSYRSTQGFTSKAICILQAQKIGTLPMFRLCMLDPKNEAWTWLPSIPDFPQSMPLFCKCESVNGEIFVIGGWHPDTYDPISSVYAFNFSSALWRRAADMLTPRSFFACGVLDGCIVIAGGHDSDKNALSSAEIYDPRMNLWKPLPEMSQGRDEAKGIVSHGKFYAVGGYPTQFQGGFTDSVDIFDPEEGCWRVMEDFWFKGAAPSTAFAWNGDIFAFRGLDLVNFDVWKKKWSAVDAISGGGEVKCVNIVGDELIVMVRIGGEFNRTLVYTKKKECEKRAEWRFFEPEKEFCGLPEFACTVEI